MSHDPLADLNFTRGQIRNDRTDAAQRLGACQAIAQSPACDRVFLRTMFDEARQVATDVHTRQLPLAGLAVSVKDLFDIAGQVTAAGSLTRAGDAPAQRDCPVVARLRAAGAAIVGRTNMTEFAFSGVGINPHFGTPANAASGTEPLIPGGSSSGAAVSVATGAAYIGLGSDPAGTNRDQAASNGEGG